MKCTFVESCSFFETFSKRQSFVWKAMIKNTVNSGNNVCDAIHMKLKVSKTAPQSLCLPERMRQKPFSLP